MYQPSQRPSGSGIVDVVCSTDSLQTPTTSHRRRCRAPTSTVRPPTPSLQRRAAAAAVRRPVDDARCLTGERQPGGPDRRDQVQAEIDNVRSRIAEMDAKILEYERQVHWSRCATDGADYVQRAYDERRATAKRGLDDGNNASDATKAWRVWSNQRRPTYVDDVDCDSMCVFFDRIGLKNRQALMLSAATTASTSRSALPEVDVGNEVDDVDERETHGQRLASMRRMLADAVERCRRQDVQLRQLSEAIDAGEIERRWKERYLASLTQAVDAILSQQSASPTFHFDEESSSVDVDPSDPSVICRHPRTLLRGLNANSNRMLISGLPTDTDERSPDNPPTLCVSSTSTSAAARLNDLHTCSSLEYAKRGQPALTSADDFVESVSSDAGFGSFQDEDFRYFEKPHLLDTLV